MTSEAVAERPLLVRFARISGKVRVEALSSCAVDGEGLYLMAGVTCPVS